MFDWEDLRHFVALSETGTLSGAARRLKVDHATVGRRVAALEQALGGTLVERRARRCVLTEAGRQVAALGDTMVIQAHAVERAMRALHAPLTGTVSVSAPPVFASHFLAPRLVRLRRTHPGLHLLLIGEAATASLSRGQADIAVRLSRPAEAGSFARQIGSLTFALYGAPDYLRDRDPAEWEFVAYDASLDAVPQQASLCRFAGSRPIVFRANDLASQISAVRSGVGLGALPHFLAGTDPDLVRVEGMETITRPIWLAVHADLRRTPAIRAVMDFVTQQVAKRDAL